MEYAHLGSAGMRVSRLSLGTVNFGWCTEESDALDILNRAHELGVNLIDTADTYGGLWGKGAVESLLGRWFATDRGRRERTVLATKVFNSFSDWPNDGGLSALHIRRACDASLRRLGTDYIDIYQLHYPDPSTSWDEIWEAMDRLRGQGKVLYLGASNVDRTHIAAARAQADRRQQTGLVSVQGEYNLLSRGVEQDALPVCERDGIGFLAWSPLAGGLLAALTGGDRRQSPASAAKRAEHREALTAWSQLCADIGADPAATALSWLLARPGVTAALLGPRTVVQLDQAMTALTLDLDAEVQARIGQVFAAGSNHVEERSMHT